MISPGETIDNQTLYRIFRVANSGGMRRSLDNFCLVLIADWTKTGVTNRWVGNTLHYTGQGRGNQKLEKQNKTLARSHTTGETLHLFEVNEPKRYTYFGEVELAGEPYQEEQPDSASTQRTVWMFPLRRKGGSTGPMIRPASKPEPYLPVGVYATIYAGFEPSIMHVIDSLIDKIRELGATTLDQRDIELRNCAIDEARWYENVLAYMRSDVRQRLRAKDGRKTLDGFSRDEIEITSATTESELSSILNIVGREDEFDLIRQKALAAFPHPSTFSDVGGPVSPLSDDQIDELRRFIDLKQRKK